MIAPYTTKKVHISELKIGDTVLIGGNDMQTVGKFHLSKSDFFGHQYKGYCHHETGGMIDVVMFPWFSKGVFCGYR